MASLSELSGIEINQNPTPNYSVIPTTRRYQKFKLPNDYKRGDRIPDLTGIQLCMQVDDADAFTANVILEVRILGVWQKLAESDVKGAHTAGESIWIDVYFDPPVVIPEGYLTLDFRFGVVSNGTWWGTESDLTLVHLVGIAEAGSFGNFTATVESNETVVFLDDLNNLSNFASVPGLSISSGKMLFTTDPVTAGIGSVTTQTNPSLTNLGLTSTAELILEFDNLPVVSEFEVYLHGSNFDATMGLASPNDIATYYYVSAGSFDSNSQTAVQYTTADKFWKMAFSPTAIAFYVSPDGVAWTLVRNRPKSGSLDYTATNIYLQLTGSDLLYTGAYPFVAAALTQIKVVTHA